MFLSILRLLPLILPLVIKLFSSLGELGATQAATEAQKKAVDTAMKEVEADMEKMISETIEKYRPKVEKAAKSLPSEQYTDRQKRIKELEEELLKDQKEYAEKNPG